MIVHHGIEIENMPPHDRYMLLHGEDRFDNDGCGFDLDEALYRAELISGVCIGFYINQAHGN